MSPQEGTNSQPAHTFIVKLASRCNLYCTYCYWFKDSRVMDFPPLLLEEAGRCLPEHLQAYASSNALDKIAVIFHGGEPLLFGKSRFNDLCERLRNAFDRSGCRLTLSVTTNGMLIDKEWTELFLRQNVRVTISLDGPKSINDARRVTLKGAGSYDKVVSGIDHLRDKSISFGILCVADPKSDPHVLLEAFVDDLGIKDFDVLIPDATHDDPPISISGYYVKLFDDWFHNYIHLGVRIRIFDVMINRLLGGLQTTDVLGPKNMPVVTVQTDGTLDVTDVVNAIGRWDIETTITARLENGIASVLRTERYRNLAAAATHLPVVCKSCDVKNVCGSGHLISRWSSELGFDNPSVYCTDLEHIIRHVWERLRPTLNIEIHKEDYAENKLEAEIP